MSTAIPRKLSFALLEALEARWRTAGWSGVERLNPGLSDAEIDEATEPLGLRLPEEVRMWWRWHDGGPASASQADTVGAAGCDCSVLHHVASPVHTVDFHNGPVGPPRAPSLGTLILWWMMAIDTGAWYFDAHEQRWEYDWEVVDLARQIGDAI